MSAEKGMGRLVAVEVRHRIVMALVMKSAFRKSRL